MRQVVGLLHNVAQYGQLQSPKRAPQADPALVPTREEEYNGVGQHLMGGSVSGCALSEACFFVEGCAVAGRKREHVGQYPVDGSTLGCGGLGSGLVHQLSCEGRGQHFRGTTGNCRSVQGRCCEVCCCVLTEWLLCRSKQQSLDDYFKDSMHEKLTLAIKLLLCVTWCSFDSDDDLVESVADDGGELEAARPDFLPMFPW